MAEGGLSVDQFSCPVCLDLLKDPVTVPCGHSYCKVCIDGCWDQEDWKGVYSCPQCRRSFKPRPVVGKNTMLAEVVEKLRNTELKDAGPAHGSAGPVEVECDFCTGRKLKAVKSCLVCLVSFCETHLQPHYTIPALKNHKLIKASRYLQEQICSQHKKLLEVYCRTDQQSICMLCTMDQHKGHDTVSATAERAEQQKLLLNTKEENQRRIQEKGKELNKLRNAEESHKRSAQAAVRDAEKIFTELICCIEIKCSEVSELIRDQEKAAVSRAEEVRKQLEEEIAELRRRNTELEEVSHTEDHIHFLQNFRPLSAPIKSTVSATIIDRPAHSFEEVVKSVPELRRKVEALFNDEIRSATVKVKNIQIIAEHQSTGNQQEPELDKMECEPKPAPECEPKPAPGRSSNKQTNIQSRSSPAQKYRELVARSSGIQQPFGGLVSPWYDTSSVYTRRLRRFQKPNQPFRWGDF